MSYAAKPIYDVAIAFDSCSYLLRNLESCDLMILGSFRLMGCWGVCVCDV